MNWNLLVCFIVMFLPGGRAFSQAEDMGARVKEQAGKLVAALMKNDWKTFSQYTNPALMKAVGGTEQMAKMMDQVVADLKAKGAVWKSEKIGEPSKILKYDTELQCTVPLTTEIDMPKKLLVIKSTLVGISLNGGKDWTFLDTVRKTVADVRQAWPHLSPGITIPPTEQTVKAVN